MEQVSFFTYVRRNWWGGEADADLGGSYLARSVERRRARLGRDLGRAVRGDLRAIRRVVYAVAYLVSARRWSGWATLSGDAWITYEAEDGYVFPAPVGWEPRR